MIRYRFVLLLLVCCSLMGVSCTQERTPCLTLKTAVMNIQCVHYKDTISTVFDTALPRAIFVAVTKTAYQYLRYRSPSSLFTLSLAPDSDTCRWLVATDSLNYPFDTVDFYYQRKLKFLSNACGYTYFFDLKQVATTHNNIDSILITDPGITNNVSAKNLKIFIHRAL